MMALLMVGPYLKGGHRRGHFMGESQVPTWIHVFWLTRKLDPSSCCNLGSRHAPRPFSLAAHNLGALGCGGGWVEGPLKKAARRDGGQSIRPEARHSAPRSWQADGRCDEEDARHSAPTSWQEHERKGSQAVRGERAHGHGLQPHFLIGHFFTHCIRRQVPCFLCLV